MPPSPTVRRSSKSPVFVFALTYMLTIVCSAEEEAVEGEE